MKNDLKISTLSVVCVLCTAFVSPASAAAPVRALGGVGTYSSASNAASAKVSGTKGSSAINAVRGGSMRVNSSASGKTAGSATGVTSTRVATTPRLSIGKYLSGSATLGSATVGGSGIVGSAGDKDDDKHGNLQQRLQQLEDLMDYVGYSDGAGADGGNITLDIETLREDLKVVTDGYLTGADFADGVLKIYANDASKDIEIDFNNYATLDALDAAVNVAIAENLADYALLSDLDREVAALEDADARLQAAIDALQDMGDSDSANRLAQLEVQIADLVNSDELTAGQISVLQGQVNQLRSDLDNVIAIDVLNKINEVLAGYVTIDTFNTELAKKANVADVYTKAEVNDLVASSGTFDAAQYYNKTEANETFATKAEIPTVPTKVSELENDTNYVNKDSLDAVERIARALADQNTESIVENQKSIEGLSAQIAGLDSTYATDAALQSVKTNLENQISGMTGGKNLGELAYKNSVSAADINNGAITAAKIDLSAVEELRPGEMVVVKKTAEGAEFVSVEVIGGNGQKI